jgi:hypothetical protein
MTEKRLRVEWVPGPAALEALDIAERQLGPAGLRTQEVIDRLVILGLWALKNPPKRPPDLWGKDRAQWTLPADLR